MNDRILLEFMVEKIIGKGEDAEPIIFSSNSSVITGVLDGMGGSGAALCNSDYGCDHTKAYVASRIIRDAIYAYISNEGELTKEKLHKICLARLQSEVKRFPSAKSILRSKLVRDYPTTISLVKASLNNEDIIIDSFWAGDSRNYLWTKEGFYQISSDDLVSNNDPLENLTNDSAISNCVCADQDFFVNHFRISIAKQPFVIFSATDGCFGYLKTPMHFEHSLASTLFASDSIENWKERLIDLFKQVTGDDFSMSLAAIGFDDFNSLKSTLGKENSDSISYVLYLQEKIKTLTQELTSLESELESMVISSWQVYKPEHMKYTQSEHQTSKPINKDLSLGNPKIEAMIKEDSSREDNPHDTSSLKSMESVDKNDISEEPSVNKDLSSESSVDKMEDNESPSKKEHDIITNEWEDNDSSVLTKIGEKLGLKKKR